MDAEKQIRVFRGSQTNRKANDAKRSSLDPDTSISCGGDTPYFSIGKSGPTCMRSCPESEPFAEPDGMCTAECTFGMFEVRRSAEQLRFCVT